METLNYHFISINTFHNFNNKEGSQIFFWIHFFPKIDVNKERLK